MVAILCVLLGKFATASSSLENISSLYHTVTKISTLTYNDVGIFSLVPFQPLYQQLQMNITEAYDSSEVKIGNFAGDTADKLDNFFTRFDLFKLQFYLGKEEAKEDWEQKKKEISNLLHTINVKIAKGYEDRAENWAEAQKNEQMR